MLLPSDVARLVLGYLQEEGLSATSRAFIHESPDLKEYAEHTAGDGAVPACVFSVFGKGLTTLLNEYVATRAKESHHEVPAVMTSLWKKLDFTLNQIKSLQNSPVISACQRTRSRVGVANMARQRVLTVASPGTILCSSLSETSSIISPMHTSLGHSTSLSAAAPLTRPAVAPATQQQQIHEVRLNAPRDSLAQAIASEQRINPCPMSPGRRKWDTPRKRAGAAGVAGAASRCSTAASGGSADPQLEEVGDENFPQLVIQNAREKMLGDRSLQEKLAENINKILASDPVPQVSKTSTTTLEADQSIDEILGLQGEIHMSDDAIHDILEQTESDPAFQALFDLFDSNKPKFPDADAEAGDGAHQCFAEECSTPSAVARPPHSDEPGRTSTDADALDSTGKQKTGQERKARKTSTLLKKTILRPSGRSSRIENSSARLLVSGGGPAGGAAAKSKRSTHLALANSDLVPPTETDEPLDTPPPPPPPPADSTDVLESVLKDSGSTCPAASPSTAPSSLTAAAFAVPELSSPEQRLETRQTQGLKGQPGSAAVTESHGSTLGGPGTDELNSFPAAAANLPQTVTPGNGGTTNPQPLPSCSSSHQSASPVSTSSLFTADSQSVSTSVGLLPTGSSSTLAPTSSTPSSCSAAVGPAHELPPDPLGASKPGAADAAVVSLQIIISDEKDEDSCSDAAPNQAVSSISGDKIPTIYLSSPARSPGVPGTPRLSSDEVAQAVSGLQHSEGQASPLSSRPGTLAGTPAVQQNYIIQLPLEGAAPAVQGAPASYFLVTEPPKPDAQPRQVLLSAALSKGSLPFSQYGGAAQASSPSYPAGSTLLLPSPAKPVMLPVSVVGQNAMGPVQMVSSQFVTIQNAVPVQQPVSGNATSPSFSAPGPEQVERSDQPLAAGRQHHPKVLTGPKHKRILCFDSSGGGQPHPTTTSTVSPATHTCRSASPPLARNDPVPVARTRPNILGGNRPKRRLQPVRCLKDHQPEEHNLVEADKPKDPGKKPSHKPNRSARAEEAARVGTESSQHKTGRQSGSERRSAPAAQDDHGSGAASADSGRNKDEGSRKDAPGKGASKPREGRVEKRAPSQEVPNVTGNKENEIKDTVQEKQAPASSFSQQCGSQAVAESLPRTPKTPSKTSSLAKQAAEMLHDIQGHHPPSEPPGHHQEDSGNLPRTPCRQKKGKDGEGTPKHLLPPHTPEVPSCSPASEAGSENSISMAAHTLIFLSRATIARTGTPLKDSLRQDRVGEKLPTSSKSSKKRKLSSPADSAPAKKDQRERKKLVDNFPRNLDVDKFLSSLHYDE